MSYCILCGNDPRPPEKPEPRFYGCPGCGRYWMEEAVVEQCADIDTRTRVGQVLKEYRVQDDRMPMIKLSPSGAIVVEPR